MGKGFNSGMMNGVDTGQTILKDQFPYLYVLDRRPDACFA